MDPSPKRPERVAGLPAFYPILDTDVAEARGLDPLAVCAGWLEAGVGLFQVRAKHTRGAVLLALADACVRLAAEVGAAVIINDRADVARLSGAAGVHLGQDDLSPTAVRSLLPAPALVGWSTHNDEQVRSSMALPIDYLAIGPVFGTRSKARPDPVVGVEGVRRAVVLADRLPIVAIGGITLETAAGVLASGAAAVAVIGDVVTPDARTRATAFLDIVSQSRGAPPPRRSC